MSSSDKINEKLYEMIFKRKSFHLFRGIGGEKISPQEIDEVYAAWSDFKPLYPDIKTAIRIVPARETTCMRGAELCVLIYSEKKDGYLANAGYLGELLDLYLTSLNIGTLWFGIGKTDEKSYNGLEYVIMIAIHKVDGDNKFRKDMFKSRRKPAEEIWEGERIDGVTDIVRFAPSACNTQPWKAVNDGGLSVYRYKKPGKRGIMPAGMVSYFNRIDIGIFLCFTELCLHRNNIEFKRELYTDDGGECELTLNAKYSFEK